MATITQDLGAVTAYGYAKDAGYTGTEAEFTQLLGDLADTVADLEGLTVSISTLPAGSSATASYADGVLSLGIPKGDKGDTGNTGATGPAAGFGTVSATVDSSVGTPSVEVSASGPDTAKQFAFAFHNLKGDKGDTGEVSEAELAAAIDKIAIKDTASGPIASFPDGADGMPLKSLVVDIDPIQDLHGYDNPWPGGGGKNKFNTDITHLKTINTAGTWNDNAYTNNGVTYTVNSDGSIKINGTASGNSIFYIESSIPATEYTDTSVALSASNISSITGEMYFQATVVNNSDSSVASRPRATPTTDTRVATVSSSQHIGDMFVRLSTGASADNVVAKFQFEIGASATSWTPYSNLCPISGHTGANVYANGGNVWDEVTELGSISSSSGNNISSTTSLRSKNYIPIKGGISYVFNKPSATGQFYVFYYGKGKAFMPDTARVIASDDTAVIFTPPDNAEFIRIRFPDGYGTTYNHDISINYPSTDHDYHAYTGTTKSLSFPSTIYGGTDEVVSGSGVNRMDLVDLSELSWNMVTEDDTDNFRARVLSYNTPDGGWSGDWNNTKSNCFVNVNPGVSYANRPFYSFCNIPQNYYNFNVKVPTNDFADAAAFKTWLANIDGNNTHAVVVIDKLTNAAFSTTPVTDLVTQYGDNNVWNDCNGDTTVEYVADPKLYINKIVGALA